MTAALWLTLAGCEVPSARQLRDGDLLFQVNGGSAFATAIHEATGRGGEVSFSHVGMVSVEADGIYVLEAEPERGVHLTPLDDFLSTSACTEDGHPMVLVKRLADSELARRAVLEGKKYMGQPYDKAFLPDNGAMYCSELVYESFLGPDGTHLLQSRPMTFKNEEGTFPAYWTELFRGLGMEVPEGVEGTNPNDMARDAALQEVFRYWE